ncbi:MAG: hypothetical protein M0P97_01875 [Candidatus Moranbacteria bacterium]|nr:hypothetical protein [Candidatus Moranbacteria bacterium]
MPQLIEHREICDCHYGLEGHIGSYVLTAQSPKYQDNTGSNQASDFKEIESQADIFPKHQDAEHYQADIEQINHIDNITCHAMFRC